ncbi:hypothetical protein LMJF_22_1020 [Leishmania major strain Friedlin]|uniref:Uncharacterized protein n=1 Tax=Leishmania major TaxID=5664 RepID=Q4QBP5_LEIMA|nr:hypothetical protein LMJF_22_1020 [Leishmania major strain Friedlin]CAG9573968.1 hypothetical_protein_-_conserved [Leishmania major strain Friedlin]CAJ04440.1 hypothetical protein LMJF_22_1020 [Leishmania major strain Friedlin]|eukprot:XP_001683253.1 hypothetical protein LMJF_22_1020 [Leishmania major strain Friedlin]
MKSLTSTITLTPISTPGGVAALSSVSASSALLTSLSPPSRTVPLGTSAGPRGPLMRTATMETSSRLSPPPCHHTAESLSKEYLRPPPSESESHVSIRFPHHHHHHLTPAGRVSLSISHRRRRRRRPPPPAFADRLDAPVFSSMQVSAPWSTAAPITGGGFSAIATSSGSTCAYEHPAWQPQLHSQRQFFFDRRGASSTWSTNPVQALDIVGGSCNALPYSCTEPNMSPTDAETPPAMLSVSSSYHDAPLSQVNGTSSVLGNIPAPPVLTCVAVFSGGEQEVFWRRACLRVTCVPVTNTSGRHREAAAEASRIAQPSVSLEEIRDSACSSSCSDSDKTGCASDKKLDLVWRWLDTLGMTDAVEDVLSPGAGRVLVVWTAGVMYEQGSRGGGASDDAQKSSAAGARLARLLGVRDGGGESRDSVVPGAPCEVVFDGMRLLLD